MAHVSARSHILLSGRRDGHAVLTVPLSLGSGNDPPTEFRLFRAGKNETRNGTYLFDEQAAELVMAAYREHGVDVMIDLEHLSVDPELVSGDARNFDPDARGYCKLELRAGELWAVQVTWTPDGAERLRNKTQRYISPAFDVDDENRVVSIHNIALTAIPATDFTPALVAASKSKGQGTMTPKQIRKLLALLRDGKSPEEALKVLAIDSKTLQAVVKAMGGDPNADLGTMIGLVRSFVDELGAAATGQPAPSEEPEPTAPDAAMADTDPAAAASIARKGTAELQRLAAENKRMAKVLTALKADKEEREAEGYRDRTAKIVQLGGLTPARAWADVAEPKPTKPAKMILAQTFDELDGWIGELEKHPPQALPVPAGGRKPAMPGGGACDVSQYEMDRLKVKCERNKTDFESAKDRYVEHKTQQVLGSRDHDQRRMMGRPLEPEHVLANVRGAFGNRELQLLTNPVKPIEDFTGAAQRSLEEFRLEFLGALASAPEVWAEKFGLMMPGGSLRDTFPLDFEAIEYREKTAQGAAASTPVAAEITVDKREFRAAKQAQLRRIQQGDFAYVRTWQSAAQTMAIARTHLRNVLVVTLLEAGAATAWGVSAQYPSGIDGANFFSATHKVNPFDSKFEFHGATTWSNYQASAKPLGAANLTGEKASMLMVPAPNGHEVGGRATGMLTPTSLDETARLLLTVQDLIMDSTATAGIRNEHYQSGFGQTWAAELTGTDTTADYYLLSDDRITRGLFPWVVAEDAAEELLIWDESSDYYKDSGLVKVESKIYCNAALGYPHGVRLVKGS